MLDVPMVASFRELLYCLLGWLRYEELVGLRYFLLRRQTTGPCENAWSR